MAFQLFKRRKSKNTKTILIVCHANITRSPYFAARLRMVIENHPIVTLPHLEINSVGVAARNGMGAHPVMGIVARMNEISLSNHRSRKIDQKIVKNSNLILTMEVAHKQIIEDEFPESKGKVFTVLEYGRKSDLPESLSVPDPTGQDVEDFREFVETAHREADRIRISIMLNGLPESV